MLHPRILVFYPIPKLHGNAKNPPGRPGQESLNEKIGIYVDFHHLSKTPPLDLSDKCVDLEALYSSIPLIKEAWPVRK